MRLVNLNISKIGNERDKTELIRLEFIDESIVLLRMEDEQNKNCLSHNLVNSLEQKLTTLSQNNSIKVIILVGLPSIFSAGADLDTLKKLCIGEIQPVDILLPKTLINVPVPLISAMEGHATGGGLALGLCADIVVLAEESRYGCSFMNMGFTPGMGITKLLEYFMSPAIAHEMLYTGSFKKGKELKVKTSFNNILPKQDVLPRAIEIARAIAEKPRSSLITLKRYLNLRKRMIFEETLTLESMMHDLTFKQDNVLQQIEDNYVG